jgi:hypothetical protein
MKQISSSVKMVGNLVEIRAWLVLNESRNISATPTCRFWLVALRIPAENAELMCT